jgi:hypothetical protein
MLAYQLEHICSYRAQLKPPEVLGAMPGGVRVNFTILGGEVSGPKLKGTVQAVGADFFTLRTDGVGILDVRACFKTHDGAMIDVAYQGVGDLGEDGYAKFLAGDVAAEIAAAHRAAHDLRASGLSMGQPPAVHVGRLHRHADRRGVL